MTPVADERQNQTAIAVSGAHVRVIAHRVIMGSGVGPDRSLVGIGEHAETSNARVHIRRTFPRESGGVHRCQRVVMHRPRLCRTGARGETEQVRRSSRRAM
jgi:hypothetical protein